MRRALAFVRVMKADEAVFMRSPFCGCSTYGTSVALNPSANSFSEEGIAAIRLP